MRRLLSTIAAFVVAAGIAPAIGAAPRQQDYSPDAVAAALQAVTIPEGDPFWVGPITVGEVDPALNQLYVIEVPTVDGEVAYEIYPDSATAGMNLVAQGEQYAIDDTLIVGSDDPASATAAARQQQAGTIIGTMLWTLDTGNGAASCGQMKNVLVCGITPGSAATGPDSPAVANAVNGLAMLAILAPPPSGGDVQPPADAAQPAPEDTSGNAGKNKKNKGDQPADQPAAETPTPEPAPAPAEMPPVEQPPSAAPAAGAISGAVIPQFAIPGGLNAPGPIPYSLTLARPIDLDLIGNGSVQAVAGYTVDEVRWILGHPGFLDGVPYAAVTEALSRRGSSLIARFEEPTAMADKLKALNWIDGYQRVFSIAGPPATVPGFVDVTVSRFKDVAGSTGAVDALAAQVILEGGMLQVPWGPFADKAIGFTGADINGTQRMALVAAGPYLITVTAVAPQGDPQATVDSIVTFIIATVSASAPASATTPAQ